MPITDYPPGEVGRRAREIYERDIRAKVEPQHIGKYLVLDIETGEYEIDEDHVAASDRAWAKHPNPVLFGMRIGYRTLGRIGGGKWKEERP